MTLADYLKEGAGNMLLQLSQDDDRAETKSRDEELIIEIAAGSDGKQTIQTGNYIGRIWRGQQEINITSRFGDPFLKRMLNFVNDIYLDDVDAAGEKSKDLDFTRYILFYLFTQSLEKAFLLGLPRGYQNIDYHDLKLQGRLDIRKYIKRDIPFLGKLSSVAREFQEDRAILDVLNKAVSIVENEKYVGAEFTKNISHIKPRLKELASGKSADMTKAINSKALLNPIFFPYRTVLRYAKYIIEADSIAASDKHNNDGNHGFIVNVAELFEIYVTKLLAKSFGDWEVSSPKINLYGGLFYERKIIPDIEMRRGKDIIVFDTKYKRMKFRSSKSGMGDLDRNDFFQINTYMSYYHQQGNNLLAGGLLYPIETEFSTDFCYSKNWLGNPKTHFIVDGLVLNENANMEKIVSAENEFLKRIETLVAHH